MFKEGKVFGIGELTVYRWESTIVKSYLSIKLKYVGNICKTYLTFIEKI